MPRRLGSRWLRLALLAAVLLALSGTGGWAAALCDLKSWAAQGELLSVPACVGAAAYTVAMALPFVPGIALAALLNLPGNAVIGGAGGIGMLAGMTRALPLSRYLLLVALATTPVPIVLLLGARL